MQNKPLVHRASSKRIAVIDIGSNSVRLVIFEGDGRLPAVAFNEKALCGLGRSLTATGRLDEKGIECAFETLDRFAALLREMRITNIRAVATAAVRDAGNGAAFIADVEARCGFSVRILSGVEEARASACGVLMGLPGADGLMGDLGGGSLEMVNLQAGCIADGITLPLSPFLLSESFARDRKATIRHIDSVLSEVSWLECGRDREFYAVGGAWRAIARIHIDQTGYPLHILQSYVVEGAELLEICEVIANMSKASLARIPGVPARRAENLPLAATILQRIFTTVRPARMVVSSMGLREGLLYQEMTPEVRRLDPLLESCHELAELSGRFPEHAQNLLEWIDPLFPDDSAADRRLRLAACMLSDVAWRGHPDYRAEKVLTEVLYGRFGGLDHRGAALIALALYICYGGEAGKGMAGTLERLLHEDDALRARKIGLSLRLGQRFSGGTSSALKFGRLQLGDDRLVLAVPPAAPHMAGDAVRRRLEALARVLGRRAAVEAA